MRKISKFIAGASLALTIAPALATNGGQILEVSFAQLEAELNQLRAGCVDGCSVADQDRIQEIETILEGSLNPEPGSGSWN